MNLEEKLNNSVNDILKSSGYIFEIIHSRKNQSNLITGTNNQLITPTITSQLTNSITKFDDILDDTICKFNDTKWCVEQMLLNRQKQEEKQRRIKENDDRKWLEEEETKKRKKEEEEAARIKKEKESQQAKEEEELRKKKEQEQKERDNRRESEKKTDANNDNFDTFMSPSFEFNLNDLPTTNERGIDIPNPSDILSTISYDGLPEGKDSTNVDSNLPNNEPSKNDVDLDMNNLLDNDALLLDGLDMNMLDQGFDGTNVNGKGVNDLQNEEFDVDNFLNQFGAE